MELFDWEYLGLRNSEAEVIRDSMKAASGRPSPRKEVKNSEFTPSTSASYQDFQKSVNDAWDIGDDEFCTLSGIKVAKKIPASDVTIHKSKVLPPIKCYKPVPALCLISEELHCTLDNDTFKIEKFRSLLDSPFLNIKDLQNLSWPGIPFPVKADCWRLLAGYASPSLEVRNESLNKKRQEYWGFVEQYYKSETKDEAYQSTYRQIQIDIPRMSPNIGLFRQKMVQDMFERILFVWSIRHPASGYVQGINDLVTPFYIVFLHHTVAHKVFTDSFDISKLSEEERRQVEADSYWCFCKFLDGIQENYIFPQLGIQHKITQLRELIQRIDVSLHNHLQSNGVEYLQFSFRWMNNLLTRELPLRCLVRLWDTYLAELETFSSFQLFVCAAFLLHWKDELLLKKDFQGLMLMLQNLPTKDWNDSHISLLVAEAHRLKFIFADAPNHFQSR